MGEKREIISYRDGSRDLFLKEFRATCLAAVQYAFSCFIRPYSREALRSSVSCFPRPVYAHLYLHTHTYISVYL